MSARVTPPEVVRQLDALAEAAQESRALWASLLEETERGDELEPQFYAAERKLALAILDIMLGIRPAFREVLGYEEVRR